MKDYYRGSPLEESVATLGFSFERILGIDAGKTKRYHLINLVNDLQSRWIHGRKLSNGELACYLGHVSMWRKFIDSDKDWGLFLEDDSMMVVNVSQLEVLTETINFPSLIQLYPANRQSGIHVEEVIVNEYALRNVDWPLIGTYAYLMNKSAASIAIDLHRKYGIISTVDWPVAWNTQIHFFTTTQELAFPRIVPSILEAERGNVRVHRLKAKLRKVFAVLGFGYVFGRILGIPHRILKFTEMRRIREVMSLFLRHRSS